MSTLRPAKRPASAQPAAFELNNRLFFRIFQTANLVHTQGTRFIVETGITTQQWSVLGALSRPQVAEGMTVGELSEYLLVTRQNLTGILDRLEAQGLTMRVRDVEDKRARRVVLTETGHTSWSNLGPLIASFYEAALSGISMQDRESFLELVNRLKKNLLQLP
jgi:MarR family transcriptional regulator, organic hydroperoxide resistance regulator